MTVSAESVGEIFLKRIESAIAAYNTGKADRS